MKPELLAPAGDLQRLKIALLYGADAVYIGGSLFGLRANATNFTIEEISQVTDNCIKTVYNIINRIRKKVSSIVSNKNNY